MKYSLLFLLMILSQTSFATYCPTNFNEIKIGDDIIIGFNEEKILELLNR